MLNELFMSKWVVNYTVFLLLFITYGVLAQNNTTDSLLKILEEESLSKSEQAHLNAELSKTFMRKNLDSAYVFAEKGLEIAKGINDKNGLVENYRMLGFLEFENNSLYNAKFYYLLADEFFDDYHDNNLKLHVWKFLGIIYDYQGDYDKALLYDHQGLKLADSINDQILLAEFQNNTGLVYIATENYQEALDYLKQASDIFNEYDDFYYYANSLVNITTAYRGLNNRDSAIFYSEKAIETEQELNNYYGLANAYMNAGDIELSFGHYDNALLYFNRSKINIDSIKGEPVTADYVRVKNYRQIGMTYLTLENYQKSELFLNKALLLARKYGYLPQLVTISSGLSTLYKSVDSIDKSEYFYEQYLAYNDSVEAEKNSNDLFKLKLEFEFQKKFTEQKSEQARIEAELLRKESIYTRIIAGVVILVLILLWLYRYQRNRTKKAELRKRYLELESEKLSTEIDHKNRELTTNMMYLLKKNEFIAALSDKLKNIGSETDPGTEQVITSMIREMDTSIRKDAWEEFEIRFNEVHVEFYNSLNKKHPDLSPNELRLCAFLRLNMSSKEISSITFQSFQSIKIARYRLRKKLKLEKGANLVSYLNQF